jgi:L-2-hydroxycarboxylate dehydrogenase (NAD+)
VTTFGAHRGFGLSLLVQLLAGPFAGATYAGARPENGAGTLIMAIDPGLLLDKAEYMASSTELCELVVGAKPLDGATVQLPGERGDARRATSLVTNEIEIADAIWEQLCVFVDG